MLTVNAYGATSAAEPLVPMTVERRDLGPRDVLIEIRYCGSCHTDISHARSEWRPGLAPHRRPRHGRPDPRAAGGNANPPPGAHWPRR